MENTMAKRMTKRVKAVRAWAWQLEEGELCYWAEPTIERLRRCVPSTDATAVRVVMMTEGEYLRLRKLAREYAKITAALGDTKEGRKR